MMMMMMMMTMMMHCFCGTVDWRKAFSLIWSWDHCQRPSPSRISDTPRAGFEPAQSSGLVEWSCAVVITTISYVLFVDIFTRSFDDFISMKFLIDVFLAASPFTPTSPFINFGDFCQPPHLLHPPRFLFWPRFASLPVYSALPFYLKLESNAWESDSVFSDFALNCSNSKFKITSTVFFLKVV